VTRTVVADSASGLVVQKIRELPVVWIDETPEVDCVFEVLNDSDAAIRVRGVVSSRGCAQARLSSMEIAAGASAELVVSTRLSQLSEPGQRSIVCDLELEDDRVWRYGFVVPYVPRLELAPRQLFLTSAHDSGKSRTVSVRAYSRSGQPGLVVNGVHASEGFNVTSVSAARTKPLAPGIDVSTQEFSVAAIEGAPGETRRGAVRFQLSNGQASAEATLSVVASWPSRFQVQPRRALFSLVDGRSDPAEIVLRVTRIDGRAFEIAKVSSPASIDAIVRAPHGRGSAQEIVLKVRPDSVFGRAAVDELRIETDDAAEPAVHVPAGVLRRDQSP